MTQRYMKAGVETGSAINHFLSAQGDVKVEVGMGATILMWTDRRAGTVVKITPTQIHVQADTETRTDSNGRSESQRYEYSPNPNGTVYVFRRTKRGMRCHGMGVSFGRREAYRDFSF